MLSRPELRQLAQRITARYHLGSLSKKEVAAYINHRLVVAGSRSRLFPPSTIGKLFQLSGGIPRLINLLCDRALLGAYVQGQDRVDKPTLSKAAREIFGKTKAHGLQRKTFRWVLASLVLIGCVAALAMICYNHRTELSALITPKPVQQKSFSEPMIEQSQLSLSDWSADKLLQRNKEMAYQSLLKQWDIIYNPDNGSACQQAQAQGLGCLETQGSLSSLLHLNRPAVLKLFDEQGQEFYALLAALRGQTAIFVVGTETWTADIKEIEKRWLGDYTMLWQIPTDYKGPIHPGQKGNVVQWLDRQLSLIQSRTTQPRKSLIFDETLVRQVKKFQLAKGLVPDGIVGPHTIIHLNTQVGSREPVLVDKQEDK